MAIEAAKADAGRGGRVIRADWLMRKNATEQNTMTEKELLALIKEADLLFTAILQGVPDRTAIEDWQIRIRIPTVDPVE